MAAAAKALPSLRSKDLKKVEKQWVDVQKVQEYEDGWYLGYLGHPDDLATLGKLMGHCSGTHFIWACEEKIWYFFALFDKDDVPHGTLHAKESKWMGKSHPRDDAEFMPNAYGGYCPECNGAGRKAALNSAGYTKCTVCKGSGNNPNTKGVRIVASHGGYPSFADVVASFEKAGQKYEAGKYRPLTYNSRTYEGGAADRYGDRNSWEYRYGDGDQFGGKKPPGITDETWAEYTKVYKALKDEYTKNNGYVKIAGRTFKFDGKNLIVLSWQDKSHYDSKAEYRKYIAEFLNAHQKVKKEVAASG